jgi:hypothetical protein
MTVAFFAAANLIMGRNGMPLGGDTYTTYQPWIKEVLSVGPIQFAQNQHFVEVLYPILASVPVYLGVAMTTEEICSPVILAVVTVGATALLAREFKDSRVTILSVAFAAGWFAIYRMGVDFRGQLLAFPLLLFATTLLLRIGKTTHVARDIVLFIVLVGLASLAHIETTAVFVAIWIITSIVFNLRSAVRRRSLLIILLVSLVIALLMLPYAIAEFPITFSCGASCRPYPMLQTYWLQVWGPEVAFAVVGLAICAKQALRQGGERVARLVLVWSLFCIVVGSLGYIFPWFDLAYSDRTVLMLPIPLLSSLSTTWLCEKGGFFARYPNLITVLIFAIPAVTAPAIFVYLVPQRFHYYSPYAP